MSNIYSAFNPPNPPSLSVMSDPRICRGSVAARRREEAVRRVAGEKREREEMRFRAGIIRNRLEFMIPASGGTFEGQTGAGQRQILALRNIECSRATKARGNFSSTKRHSVARMAGQLRRRYVPSFDPLQGQQVKCDPSPMSHLSITNSATTTIKVSKPIQQQNRFELNTNPFKNVRFQKGNDAGGVTQMMPILPMEQVSVPPLLPSVESKTAQTKTAHTAHTKNAATNKYRIAKVPFRRRLITWSDMPSPEDPPPTARGPPTFNDSSVQTEEEKAFENTFSPLISSLVTVAISDALRTLMEEEKILQIAYREQELIEIVQSQNIKNIELNRVLKQQIALQKELEKQKASALCQLRALEARTIAADELQGVANKSVEELISQNMIQSESGRRSVAADTRQLERRIARSQRVAAEVRSDFFPYVYARAERIFIERLAGTYLKDALFARDEKRRDDAQDLLNAQIFKYNQLITQKAPS